MLIKNSFNVPLGRDATLTVLTDVPALAPCVPGVELTEEVDERIFKGTGSVRLGPVKLSFAGEAEITEIDSENYSAKVRAKGADIKGRGGAEANVSFMLIETDSGTQVDIQTDLGLSGSVAQYGRASGLIEDVAQQIIDQFAKELCNTLTGQGDAVANQEISGLKVLMQVAIGNLKTWVKGVTTLFTKS